MKRSVPRLQGAARDVAKGELIGAKVTISKSTDAGLEGLQGVCVDETLHTLSLRIGGPGGRRMQLSKVGNTFTLDTEQGPVDLDGSALEFRSWDRTKKVR